MEQLVDFWKQVSFVDVIEFLGTFAFAISGIRLASAKKLDWFGAFVVGFVTATGGGTLRDLLLGVVPFWMTSGVYAWCTVLSLLFVIVFRKKLVHLNGPFLWFDSIGLGLFVVVGVEKALTLDYSIGVVVTMGTITGVVGGMIRDILINEIPAVFTQELYAVACILGALLYYSFDFMGVSAPVTQISTAIFVFVIRIAAARYKWKLPVLKGEQ
ncbi:trimeric intracellular cation channel family protein [Flavobacterium sp. HSC-61S13]|uniref:trimeric intracellular cation channel family protein n=1 Tax=Flavobacterium sp. HSC-61S13 TaxID=2910963 RepID=UPI00209F01EE|nr:trimeric intracellular cation channel family protein [Flavobacterium sp. HSC-61S13]MCP1997153.1 putative membrane protein YeiH [Flavobacterium sp. HSC-61S13]